MAEPSSTAIAAAGSLAAAAALGEWLGIEPSTLLWGAAGGLAMLSLQPPMPRMRALIALAVAALTAGALTEVIAPWGAVALPTAPPRGLAHGTAFLLGFSAQRLLPTVMDTIPQLGGALLERVRGGGRNG